MLYERKVVFFILLQLLLFLVHLLFLAGLERIPWWVKEKCQTQLSLHQLTLGALTLFGQLMTVNYLLVANQAQIKVSPMKKNQ